MSNNSDALISLQNYIKKKHGVNVHLTTAFKNALNNLSEIVSEFKNGSSLKKLKKTSSSDKKVSKTSTNKSNKNQILLKLNFLQKNLKKEYPNDDPEIKELIDIFVEKNDIIEQLLNPDNKEILDAIFDEMELYDDTLMSVLHNHDLKELVSAIEKHEKIENDIDIYQTELSVYNEYANVLIKYDQFDQEIIKKHNTNESIDKMQRQMHNLKKACDDVNNLVPS